MKITYTGRKVTLKPAFIERTEAALAKLDKFFSEDAQAQVTVTVEKDRQTVEITVRDKGVSVRAERVQPRMEDALDEAVDVLGRRIVKNRKRLNTKLCRPAYLLGHSFFLFRDAETDEVNVVYRRADGTYGLLIPER